MSFRVEVTWDSKIIRKDGKNVWLSQPLREEDIPALVTRVMTENQFGHARYAGLLDRISAGIAKYVHLEQKEDVPVQSSPEDRARIEALEKELAELRAKASAVPEVQTDATTVPVVAAALPPPSTYAEAVRREFNRSRHAEARADKLNRAKMAAVSAEAAAVRQRVKEAALRDKYKEGYIPLDQRKKLAQAAVGTAKKNKATAVEKVASAAFTFVRYTKKQMKAHQSAILAATGGERWFTAAERAAYKLLPSSEKARLRVQRIESAQLIAREKAMEREKFRKQRAERITAQIAARQTVLAGRLPKGKAVAEGDKACVHVLRARGKVISCTKCGFVASYLP